MLPSREVVFVFFFVFVYSTLSSLPVVIWTRLFAQLLHSWNLGSSDSWAKNPLCGKVSQKLYLFLRKMLGVSQAKVGFSNGEPLLIGYLIGVPFLGACLCVWRWRRARSSPTAFSTIRKKPSLNGGEINIRPAIMPWKGFDWESTEPLKLRPFHGKEKYNLTMGNTINP